MENLKIKKMWNKYNYVCGIHFQDEAKCDMRLRKNAVPTLHLGYCGLVAHKYIRHYTVKRKCCVKSCKIQYTSKDLKTYSFPFSKNEKLAWARACNLPLPLPETDLYICERHFERKYASKKRLPIEAFPKFFLRDEDGDQNDGRRKIPGVETEEFLSVKLTHSRAIEDDSNNDISTEESEYLDPPPEVQQIQNLSAQIEGLKKRVIFLEKSGIYPQPRTSDECLTFAKMIVGSRKTEYTEKEKALAKKLRSNMFSNDYSFMKQGLDSDCHCSER
ncbi:unnamed protein product [Ceratitis capitata]|uniref:(Mediterranean fruit fly) hypothetical protein n=1 Tax=Ceratitis capitata TaxID=7213 RepID=A0A811V9J2_CERCA|nr:unnamed protein product [Ceratitis capitata]